MADSSEFGSEVPLLGFMETLSVILVAEVKNQSLPLLNNAESRVSQLRHSSKVFSVVAENLDNRTIF